jgi:hypothetical protein
MSELENADTTSGPGPWFVAAYGSTCSRCGDDIVEGDAIRADGAGGWECENCDEAGHPNRRSPFTGTTDEEMGF